MKIYKCGKIMKKVCNRNCCWKKLNKPAIISLDIFTSEDVGFYRLSPAMIKFLEIRHFSIEKGQNIYHNRLKKRIDMNVVWKNWISQPSFILDIFTLKDAVFHGLSPDVIKFLGDPHFSLKLVGFYVLPRGSKPDRKTDLATGNPGVPPTHCK